MKNKNIYPVLALAKKIAENQKRSDYDYLQTLVDIGIIDTNSEVAKNYRIKKLRQKKLKDLGI